VSDDALHELRTHELGAGDQVCGLLAAHVEPPEGKFREAREGEPSLELRPGGPTSRQTRHDGKAQRSGERISALAARGSIARPSEDVEREEPVGGARLPDAVHGMAPPAKSRRSGNRAPAIASALGFQSPTERRFLPFERAKLQVRPAALRPESTVSVDREAGVGAIGLSRDDDLTLEEGAHLRRCQDLVLPRLAPSEPERMRGVGGAERRLHVLPL